MRPVRSDVFRLALLSSGDYSIWCLPVSRSRSRWLCAERRLALQPRAASVLKRAASRPRIADMNSPCYSPAQDKHLNTKRLRSASCQDFREAIASASPGAVSFDLSV